VDAVAYRSVELAQSGGDSEKQQGNDPPYIYEKLDGFEVEVGDKLAAKESESGKNRGGACIASG
jgi:hypothetical protein